MYRLSFCFLVYSSDVYHTLHMLIFWYQMFQNDFNLDLSVCKDLQPLKIPYETILSNFLFLFVRVMVVLLGKGNPNQHFL